MVSEDGKLAGTAIDGKYPSVYCQINTFRVIGNIHLLPVIIAEGIVPVPDDRIQTGGLVRETNQLLIFA